MRPTHEHENERPAASALPEAGSGTVSGGAIGGIELPVGRAFLVQLASDCDVAGQAVRGRVEHVRSGEATRFQSLSELAVFMLGVLRQTSETGS